MQGGLQALPRPRDSARGRGAPRACIDYQRENVTALYLSAKRAKTQGCWGHNPELQRSCDKAQPPPAIGEDFEEYHRNYTWWFRKVKESCDAAGRPTIYLTTESYLKVKSLLELALA